MLISNSPRPWHGTNYAPIYSEDVGMTPRPRVELETFKSRMAEKHNLDLPPSVAIHKYRQSPLWLASLSVPMALGEGISVSFFGLGAFEKRAHDSPTAQSILEIFKGCVCGGGQG